MLSRLKSFFICQFFSDHFPVTYRVYMLFCFEIYVLSIGYGLFGIFSHQWLGAILFQVAYVALCTLQFVFPYELRKKLLKPHLLFTTMLYIPFLFFQTAGYNGPSLLFMPLCTFLLSVVFLGRTRILLIISHILLSLSCIAVQYLFPFAVHPHPSSGIRVANFFLTVLFTTGGIALMTVYIHSAYQRSNQELSDLTKRDTLTGLYNRRYLFEFLQRELASCRQTEHGTCVMMLDIDLFKRVNDTYGHGFGDEVLRAFAKCVHSILREYDVLARYGGEEFVAVIHALDLSSSHTIAERIRIAVSQLTFRDNIHITVSIGLTCSLPSDTAESVISRADACMYQAKQNGRNQVFSDSDIAPTPQADS